MGPTGPLEIKMFYVLSEDYSYDGSKNIWAGNNLVQLFDRDDIAFIEEKGLL